MNGELIIFAILAAVSVVCGISVVLQDNPVRSALSLVLVLLSMSMLFLTLHAAFISAIQVIVYAGAIMVLFVFVIMLLNLGSPDKTVDQLKPQRPLAFAGGLVLILIIAAAILAVPTPATHLSSEVVGPYQIGIALFAPNWVFPFEAVSILLLVAAIGAVVLAKRRFEQ